MRIFLDANVLVSVLNKEYPFFTYTSRIISLADKPGYALFTTPVCLAIAFYFAEKKFKNVVAKRKVAILCKHIRIAPTDKTSVEKTLENPAINDFEDGIEYYAAIESRCECLITEDTNDFYFSEIEVITSQNFFEKYMN